ncbi:MAG: type 2 lanthipeptide synthetase LanM family protein [Burkholderiaceae bacterium]
MTAPIKDAGDFDASLGFLFSSSLDELVAQLSSVAGLEEQERVLLVDVTRETLLSVVGAKLTRLMLLELNAARVRGQLTGDTGEQRFEQFIAMSARPEFWLGLDSEYPDLRARVRCIVDERCASTVRFAARFADDRDALAALCGAPLGRLVSLSFGAGDAHQNGQTVALVRCCGGRVVYKPRSLAVDAALGQFIDNAMRDDPVATRIRVPRVLERQDYGWTAFVEHRHAADAAELSCFYLGIGHWLAVMRLVSGSDLHAENLIACGPTPVVVDCETLFTPRLKAIPTGLGNAADRAMETIASTVLNCGLLPGRGAGLGWRGVDSSALGSLPGQQPKLRQLQILHKRSDEARIGTHEVDADLSQNHPSANPVLADHWPCVLRGFDQLTARLQAMDARGEIEPLLAPFRACRIRIVPRATEVYAELGRMLWHPVSLHKPEEAVARAHELLMRMGMRVRVAPSDPAVVAGEVADLLDGNVPFFTTIAGHGVLEAPRGTTWMRPCDLVSEALVSWRAADFGLERRVIQAALVSAYINDGWMPEEVLLKPARIHVDGLDARRRRQAAGIMSELVAAGIHGDDGTVTWIAPILGQSGWAVQPLDQDLYNGASGTAVLVAAYLREVEAGRADPVPGVDVLLPQLTRMLHNAEALRDRQRSEVKKPRPGAPGGFIGLGSQIWAWLLLRHWDIEPGAAIERACAIADYMPDAVAADTVNDILIGKAGAVVPLLMLAKASGQRRFLDMAVDIGDRLCAAALATGDKVHWPHSSGPDGLGGFAHGVSGIGWALQKLASASGHERFANTAAAAFRFEDSLYDEQEQNWLDMRRIDGVRTAAAWCHGAVGIGLAQADLHPGLVDDAARTKVRRAAAAAWRQGMGWNQSLCHGDFGSVELLLVAIDAGLAPEGMTRESLLAHVVGAMETHGPVSGITRGTFSPGLLPGLGGVAYQLLRMHPDSDLPSLLTLAGGAF